MHLSQKRKLQLPRFAAATTFQTTLFLIATSELCQTAQHLLVRSPSEIITLALRRATKYSGKYSRVLAASLVGMLTTLCFFLDDLMINNKTTILKYKEQSYYYVKITNPVAIYYSPAIDSNNQLHALSSAVIQHNPTFLRLLCKANVNRIVNGYYAAILSGKNDRMQTIQLNLRTKDTLGTGLLSFLRRLSLSRRFTVF